MQWCPNRKIVRSSNCHYAMLIYSKLGWCQVYMHTISNVVLRCLDGGPASETLAQHRGNAGPASLLRPESQTWIVSTPVDSPLCLRTWQLGRLPAAGSAPSNSRGWSGLFLSPWLPADCSQPRGSRTLYTTTLRITPAYRDHNPDILRGTVRGDLRLRKLYAVCEVVCFNSDIFQIRIMRLGDCIFFFIVLTPPHQSAEHR